MNKLEQLRKMTDVVADTGDIEAIVKYKPVDATTNPSLLLKAAASPQYSDLIDDTVATVKAENVSEKDLIKESVDSSPTRSSWKTCCGIELQVAIR